jgi:hypothetical protein
MPDNQPNDVPPRNFTSFEELARTYAPELPKEKDPKIFIAPDIPDKKLKKAIDSYATDITPEHVLAMWDSTVFGSGKKGFLITERVFYYSELMDKPWVVPYESIENIKLEPDEDNIPWIRIKLPDRLLETNDGIDIKIYELSDFLKAAIKFYKK